MTPLGRFLLQHIADNGPIPLSDFMQHCLLHPEHGYYNSRDPFGSAGDFITAPEISQMFGELIGLCLAQNWLDQGAPDPVVLAELGPGRGTLMADILRSTKHVPGFHAALEVHLVEASPVLRAKQAELLPDAVWHDSISDLPQTPLWLIANEFFDALPIRQYQRLEAGWAEMLVGARQGKLVRGLGAPLTEFAALAHRREDTSVGDIVEINAPALSVMAEINARLQRWGGAALIVDYGHWRSLGDTFQALKNHMAVEPLAEPGQADLTAHVDFEALMRAAPQLLASRMNTQGLFLETLGISARAQALAKNLQGAALEAHIAAHRRLTHGSEMGDLFKVIGFVPQNATQLPGLDP